MRDCRVAPETYYVGMKFTAAITHEGDLIVARCLEIEVTSQGANVDEAIDNLREAIELFFEDQDIPSSIENPVITTFQLTA
jgi:predicted RNase H-like HicB family nuclease